MSTCFIACLNPLNLYVTRCALNAVMNQGRPLLKRCRSLSPAPHARIRLWVLRQSRDAFWAPGKWGAAWVCIWGFFSQDPSAEPRA